MYDAVLLLSYGGPEGEDEVIPFLERATRGRNVPRQRLLKVAEHYMLFQGISPINAQNRALIEALKKELMLRGHSLPIYFGNRNSNPLLEDTLLEMRKDGVQRALAFVTSAFSSYSGCRQYLEDISGARSAIGTGAPEIDKIRVFFNHPGFIEANATRLRSALLKLPAVDRDSAHVVFTAHSIPTSMARSCAYESQISESSALVATSAGATNYSIAYQSRSGPANVSWLGPDINEHIRSLAKTGVKDAVVLPIGFLSDHLEVAYDLDHEARVTAETAGIRFHRVATVGTCDLFVSTVGDLIEERVNGVGLIRRSVGTMRAWHDHCPPDCCRACSATP